MDSRRSSRSTFEVSAEPLTIRDALRALTAVNQDVVLLDYANVVIRRNYQDLKTVRLLGGGVGGYDLSHATFVGKGMLTAAILGDDASPGSRQILRTIKELNEGENCGVFVIAQANSDLFNFGLAVERANTDCRTRVKLLPINDDKSVRKERYSCGYILLTKILGAMTEEGAFFDDVYRMYQDIVEDIVTVPISYNFEEAGPQNRRSISLSKDFEDSFKQVISKNMKSTIDISLHPSVPIVALINTSKTLDRLTEFGLIKQVVETLGQGGVSLARLYHGNFVQVAPKTASLTILKVMDVKIIQYLDAHCDAPGFFQVTQFLPEISLKNEISGLLKYRGKQEVLSKGAKLGESQNKAFYTAVKFACDAITSCERQLNTIDSEKSDGTVGSRLKNLADTISKKLNNKKLPTDRPYVFLKKLGVVAETVLGGSMGSIYSILFENAATVFEEIPETETVSCFSWFRALSVATNAIKQYCVNEKGELNMFYPIKCCELGISRERDKNQDYLQCYGFGVTMAEEAAQRTKSQNCQYPDAGAHAVGIWMRALFEGVKLMSSTSLCDSDFMT